MKKYMVSALLCAVFLVMQTDPVPAKETITLGSVIMNNSGDWFDEALKGQRDAASDLDVDCIFFSSDNEISKESDNVASCISEQVDALVISPLSSNASVKTIESATINAGIPVVTWNTTVNTDVVCHIGVDSKELGASTGRYAAGYIKEHMPDGCLLAMIGNSNYETGLQRCEGFRSALEELLEDGTVTIAVQQNAEFQDESYQVTQTILEEYPDIQMIWCWNQISLLGCISAVKDADRRDIIILGTDMSEELAEEMLDDKVSLLAITTQPPYEMGYTAVQNAVAAVKGEEVNREIILPTQLYTKDDPEGIRAYMEEEKALTEQ